MTRKRRTLTSSQIIILGFAALILAGALLLMLPFSTKSGEGASFADALFTATSAVCVTGLIVQDTATYWSVFGQAVILSLIQVGGLGVVTMALAITTVSGRTISLKQRSAMQETIAAPKVGGIVRLTSFILRMTLTFELCGMLLMAPVFCRDYGLVKGLWYSMFHSISAFCNAGFDLMGVRMPYSSLTHYHSQPLINIAIMALIIIGGLGFSTWDDIRTNKLRLKKYRMQSKVILTTTAVLLILPAIYFFFFELENMPFTQRFWGSLFQSVTPRTAGFNTVNLGLISETGVFIMIMLMLIGGSPGSTAGGMKTTTFAVLLSTMLSVFRQKEHTHFFGRRVAEQTIRNAATIMTMYIALFVSGALIISKVEGISLLTCLFETASAVGTVGLTLGITPSLGMLSRSILILLMYCGRVGGLTIIFAALTPNQSGLAKLPQEKLTVG